MAQLFGSMNHLLRACSIQGSIFSRAPFLSLSSFNPAVSCPRLPVCQRRWYARRDRGAAVQAGRRNIFLNPQEVPSSSYEGLYDSSQFNDDDDDSEELAGGELAAEMVVPATGVTLPRAKHTRVRTAEFIKSSVSVKDCPKPVYPEFAVIGRSNVGKSSLINMLTGRKSLAMVSKTPGKTRCINHFLINNSWYLVDLPGYGYAKSSKETVLSWNKFTREYFTERETLVSVLLLVDASIPPMALDVACADWFGDAQIPYTVVFTKADKRKKNCPPAEENIAAFGQELLKNWDDLPPTLITSSKSSMGKSELLAHIAQLREVFNKGL